MSSERRLILPTQFAAIESRAEGDSPILISGYAAVFYRSTEPETEYRADYDMVERIMPGAFDAYLMSAEDCTCSPDHDDRQLLGRRSSGRLSLAVDDRGLRYSLPYDASDPDHQRVRAKIARRDITGSSIRFIATEERWMRDIDTGMIIRELIVAQVKQLGPVTNPAYPGTTAEAREAMSAGGGPSDGGWSAIQMKKAAFLAAEELGHEALLIEFGEAIGV
jgi:HK97 family phage prohead protease